MRKKHITDNQIRQFYWKHNNSPFDNKASYLLGDLRDYGVSRCKKIKSGLESTFYEFDIYKNRKHTVALLIELSTDFTIKEVERAIVRLCEHGGLVASDDNKTFDKWKKAILPKYHYDHAKYSALRFLEGLRREIDYRMG